MGCPIASLRDWAYMCKYYPDVYDEKMSLIKNSEIMLKNKGVKSGVFSGHTADEVDMLVKYKYMPKMFERKSLF